MSEDVPTARIREELTRIVPVVSELTGLPSNWNGEVVLVPDAEFKGKKLFSCSILMDAALGADELRWRTLIHEAIHAVSVGFNRTDYGDAEGWEEGVVEQLQRLLRPRILTALGVTVNDTLFAAHEAAHLFNERVAAMERLRRALDRQDETRFYVELLATPIKDRPGRVLAQSSRLSTDDRKKFVGLFSRENSLLKAPVRRGM